MSVKLTEARREMLRQLVERPGPYASYYPPLKWLWNNGLAEEYGKGDLFRATPEGRALLAQERTDGR